MAGLVGSGRSELVRTLFGIMHRKGGETLLDGEPVVLKDATQALSSGSSCCPRTARWRASFPTWTCARTWSSRARDLMTAW